MGNQMCFPSKPVGENGHEQEETPIFFPGAFARLNVLAEELSEAEKTHKYLDKLLVETQNHNLELMTAELNNDINLFILNNLLMCVQFWPNFESTNSAAKTFKQEIENHIAEKLAPLADKGVIHGDRRSVLLHGLPHELSKFYIYVDKQERGKLKHTSQRSNFIRFLNEDGLQNCESIMPLEFVMTWDNLEIYKESEFAKMKEYEYSSTIAINRFCMEESSSNIKVPKGYVRLRCVDIPLSIKQGNRVVEDDGYSYLSDFNDGPDEVHTDSDVVSGDGDGEEGEIFSSGNAMMKAIEKRLQGWSQPSLNANKSLNPQNEKFPQTMTRLMNGNGIERRPSGILPQNYPKPKPTNRNIDAAVPHSSSSIPQIEIRPPSNPELPYNIGTRNRSHSVVHRTAEGQDFLNPHNRDGESRYVPKLDINGNLTLQQVMTSGYESQSSAISRGSSVTSEDIREKWRKTEIKKLWEFRARTRKSKEPIPDTCFLEVLIEAEEDEAAQGNQSDDVSEFGGSDYSSDTNSEKRQKLLREEPNYEKRTYLNSVAFSSDFCSEFMQIGTQMGLSSVSLEKAMVVGTTILCPVIYPGGLQSSTQGPGDRDTFRFLYAFTPSIQSKCMPQLPVTWWVQKAKNEDEKWPQPRHIESIQALGANIFPLGHRSINNTQFENLQQILEWQVGHVQAENVLLNSLKSVHWRALIFSSLLFRAFLAPLGPLGIGLAHFRNTLYHMCHQEFISWNDEQPGLHLQILIQKVYDNLSRGNMQNFFIHKHNMLATIPTQNTRMIQAHLRKIRDNLLVHLIFAFRNMKPATHRVYEMPNFVKLYHIITTRNDKDLLSWIMSSKAFQNPSEFGSSSNQDTLRRQRMSKRKRRKHRRAYNIRRGQEGVGVDMQLDGERHEDDDDELKHRKKLFRKYERLENYQRQREREQEESQAEASTSGQEKSLEDKKSSASIDLRAMPVKNYRSVRRHLLLKFFIEHFIHMAERSLHFSAFSQAAMYVLHMENLCEILASINSPSAAMDAQDLRHRVNQIREEIGVDHMREYIKSKNSSFDYVEPTVDPLSGLSMTPLRPNTYSNNITLGPGLSSSRELPAPPRLSDSRPRIETPRRTMPAPNFMQSLMSLPATDLDIGTEDESIDQNPLLIPRVKDPSTKAGGTILYLERPPSQYPKLSNASTVGDSTDL